MRRLVVKPLALALVLAGVSIGLGQSDPQIGKKKDPSDKAAPAKSKLEEMLAEALKNNPDLRVAVAKAAEAEAELNRTRLQVSQKVVALYYAIDTQKKAVEHEEKRLEHMQQLRKTSAISNEVYDEAQQALTLAKAKLTELEVQMPALLGKTAYNFEVKGAERVFAGGFRTTHGFQSEVVLESEVVLDRAVQDQRKVQGLSAERMRKVLETLIKVDYKDMKFSDVVQSLQKSVPGLHINSAVVGYSFPPITLRFDEALPISSILQAVADSAGVQFYVREYGILVAIHGHEPPGAVTVQEFLRQKPAEQSKPKNPPAEIVEGVIKQVDDKGLVVISIGSDAGLAKGHTLEVFRLAEQPSKSKYLGTIRIIETKPNEAVGQPIGRMTDTPKAGDRVASRLVGK